MRVSNLTRVIRDAEWTELSEAWSRLDETDRRMVVDLVRGLSYLRQAVRDNDVEDLMQVHVDVGCSLRRQPES